ncbi:unnamed protein product [Protopolystoma xenopodis]|uniref:Golgin subfamily A conserved domain-containing protein n=1 Tax=Protopolystoma xenopodis TaxID=117903 RepID=A0A3S5BY07_9PLAT|nr:unnamed protein product [Protopolystoma xenopodis]
MSQVRAGADRSANELHARMASLTGELTRAGEATRSMQQRADQLAEEVERLREELTASRASELHWVTRDQETGQAAMAAQNRLEKELKVALLELSELTAANQQLRAQLDEHVSACCLFFSSILLCLKVDTTSHRLHLVLQYDKGP